MFTTLYVPYRVHTKTGYAFKKSYVVVLKVSFENTCVEAKVNEIIINSKLERDSP